jgi:predicted nucleotidyltransferase
MKMAVDSQLEGIIGAIVEAVLPKKIILFGSRARGDARADSDYDFLIVKDGIGNEREVTRLAYRALLRHGSTIPVDLIAVDTAVFERRKEDPGMIYYYASVEGIVVYG